MSTPTCADFLSSLPFSKSLKYGECCKGRYFADIGLCFTTRAFLPIRGQEERGFDKAKQGEIPALSHLSKPDELTNFD